MARTKIPHADAPDLQSDSEAAAHAADTTSVHGIADTSLLSTTAHDHDADYEAAGGIATHSADSTAVHGIADTSALSLTSHDHDADYEAAGGIATHAADSTAVHGIVDTSALALTSHDHSGTYELFGTVGTHSADSTAIHGIADTSVLATASSVSTAISTHAGLAEPHTGYRLESADHTHATTGAEAGTVAHSVLTGVTADQHHAQLHAATHVPTGTDPVDKFVQSSIGTLDQAIANTETVVLAKVFAANELTAGMMFRFEAWFTKAGTNASSAVIRIRIGTTTLTGTIMATLTPPANALAVPGKIEGLLRIVTAGAGGTARGELQQFVHLAAVTVTSAIGPSTATGAVNTTTANQRVELTFISGNAANTYTFRNAVMYRVA